MLNIRAVFFIAALVSHMSYAGLVHELARGGNWDAVQQKIDMEAASISDLDANGETLLDIAKSQGREEEFIRRNPQLQVADLGIPQRVFLGFGGSQPVGAVFVPPVYARPPQVVMENPMAPPRTVVNLEAARIQIALADAAFNELQQYLDKVASLRDGVEKVKFVQAYRAYVQETTEKLRKALRTAFEFSGRSEEVNATPLFSDNRLFTSDRCRLKMEETRPGFCERSSVNRCLTKRCWSAELVDCMHCGWDGQCDCCRKDTACCVAYSCTVGLYGIVVGVVAGIVGVAQGVSITACAPCMCKWHPAETKEVGEIDETKDTKLQSFIAEMKVLRDALERK